MASDSTATVPQWKRDLIQRRRQQNRSLGVYTAIAAIADIPDTPNTLENPVESSQDPRADAQVNQSVQNNTTSGAAVPTRELNDCGNVKDSVACTMHLENGSPCPPDDKMVKICDNRRSRIDKFNNDDCESDSSEELQYGPGIVNKLKSKYLNLTLREMNKTRSTVQRFRRAASLEDLLDCDQESEKTRKFTKKQGMPKTERFRNSSRGNDSMKRARSVEALMRYQSDDNKLRQEPVNDHIVLIDRTSVSIENRLKNERPKAINKPKRIRPLLADTERPPPDLVKTTLRIFEGSVKKHKPKGEVAVKVATFKTINDTFKAQSIRKVVPKPPLQPKPFVNGNSKTLGMTKKTIPMKSIDVEHPEGPVRNNGVSTEPIVQSVSSVVSKFQQIEKSCSSPEPTQNKYKFSPAPSPEPKVKSSTEGCAKAVPIVLCPLATKTKDLLRQNSNSVALNDTLISEESLVVIQERNPLIVEITETREDKIFPIEEIKPLEEHDKIESEGSEESKSMELTFENESNPSAEAENSSRPSNGTTDHQSESQSPEPVDPESNQDKNRIQDADLSNRELKIETPQVIEKPIGAISSLGLIKSSYPPPKLIKPQKSSPVQKQIGIIRPLVSMKTQIPQQNLSNRELEKNLINRVKNIEQPTKVVVSLKTADEIQPVKKTGAGEGSGGLWDTKPWNQQNNTMVFNFSNRKDVPDYIENDGLIIRRKREKPKVGDGGIIVLDATLDASTTDEGDWEMSRGPPSPCDVLFTNDNVVINGRSNLIRTPRNHKNRIQFDDDATRTFEYPSEASMLEDDAGSCLGGETSATGCNDDYQSSGVSNNSMATNAASPILGGGGLASYTPSKVDLKSDNFELGVTRSSSTPSCPPAHPWESSEPDGKTQDQEPPTDPHDAAAWGAEATADLLY